MPEAHGRPSGPVLFVRCDDVTTDSWALGAVHDVLAERGVPCAWACIPADLTADAAARLGATPIMSLHQHGWNHQRLHPDGTDSRDELVGYRTVAEQRAAIERGREAMTRLVQAGLDLHTFTPPRHRYTRATLQALRELGVQRISAGVYFDLPSRLVCGVARRLGVPAVAGRGMSRHDRTGGRWPTEVSTSVNIDLARSGDTRPVEVNQVLAEVADAARFTDTIGLLLHHDTYEGDPARVASLGRVLDRLLEQHRFVDLRSLPALVS
jgi:hypothetical protein